MKRQRVLGILLPILLVLIGFAWVYPFIWLIFSSFKTNTEYIGAGIALFPKEFRWENYVRAWETANFSVYFKNSVMMTVSSVLLVLFICSLAGYALGRYRFPGKKILLFLIVATMFLPKGYTIIPIFQVIKGMGLLNTLPGVILADSASGYILFLLLFISFFQGIPKELEEASEIDGSGFVRTFVQIMLPLSKPIVATTAIMQFIFSWNSFFVPLIFTLNRPDLRPLSVGMYSFTGENSIDFTGMAAGAAIAIVPIIIIFILFQRYFVEGIAGSVKG